MSTWPSPSKSPANGFISDHSAQPGGLVYHVAGAANVGEPGEPVAIRIRNEKLPGPSLSTTPMSSRQEASPSKLPTTSFMSARFQQGRLCDGMPKRPLRADRCTVSRTPPESGPNTATSASPSPSKSPSTVLVEPGG